MLHEDLKNTIVSLDAVGHVGMGSFLSTNSVGGGSKKMPKVPKN